MLDFFIEFFLQIVRLVKYILMLFRMSSLQAKRQLNFILWLLSGLNDKKLKAVIENDIEYLNGLSDHDLVNYLSKGYYGLLPLLIVRNCECDVPLSFLDNLNQDILKSSKFIKKLRVQIGQGRKELYRTHTREKRWFDNSSSDDVFRTYSCFLTEDNKIDRELIDISYQDN